MTKVFYNKKLFLLVGLLGAIFSLIQIPGDLDFISKNVELNKNIYIIGRFLLAFSFLLMLLLNYKKTPVDIKDSDVLTIASLLTIYSIHGQFFSPGYFMAYMQTIISFSLFFAIPKVKFKIFLVLSGILMTASVFYSNVSYSSIPELVLKFKLDVVISIIIVNVLSYFGYKFVTVVQSEKDQLSRKFLDIGKNTASIIHDLKGVMFSPAVYIELLDKKLRLENKTELLPILNNLKSEFSFISEYVKNLNDLSKSHGFTPTDVNIKNQIDIICNVLLKNRLKNVDIKVEGVEIINGNFYQIKSSIMNLFVNSLENFKEKKISDPKIIIDVEPQKITFKDNGGGFPEKVLKSFKQHSSFTTKKEGSGLGLFLIHEFMSSQGGDVHIKNEGTWAVVELIFNKEYKQNETQKGA